MAIRQVAVYAASSQALDPVFYQAAERLGQILAEAGVDIVYGGGRHGLMGAMADGALAGGGSVRGVIPEFLTRIEQGHPGLAHLDVVADMHTRKARMLAGSDAAIALPGGCGTLEELFEVMTLKRLGQFLGPIIILNTDHYYADLLSFMRRSVELHFMNRVHLDLFEVVDGPEQVLDALARSTSWSHDRLHQAAVRPR